MQKHVKQAGERSKVINENELVTYANTSKEYTPFFLRVIERNYHNNNDIEATSCISPLSQNDFSPRHAV